MSDAAAMPHKAAHAEIARGPNVKLSGISGLGAASAGESDSTLQYRGQEAKATPPLLCTAGEPSSTAATSLGQIKSPTQTVQPSLGKVLASAPAMTPAPKIKGEIKGEINAKTYHRRYRIAVGLDGGA